MWMTLDGQKKLTTQTVEGIACVDTNKYFQASHNKTKTEKALLK